MIYLASPFSSAWPAVQEVRFIQVRDATLTLLKRGHVVFSPIAYSYQFSEAMGGDFDSWMKFDLHMIDIADEVWVLKLDGWEHSKGVIAEIRHARTHNKPVRYLDPETLMEVVG